MALNFGSRPTDPIPNASLEDVDTDLFLVCFEPDAAGVINNEPALFSKSALSTQYPHIVEAWEVKQQDAKEEAERIDQNALAFAHYLQSPNPRILEQRQIEPQIACDQRLFPGMSEHWGELRKCESQHPCQGNRIVCKGCRVSHYLQNDRGFDRRLIMAQGARVPVCESCAAALLDILGIGYHKCICDTKPSCYRCRESLLEKLAKARKDKHIDGSCGQCGGKGLVEFADFCLYCERMRVYTVRFDETL